MTWELRHILPVHFAISFADIDTVSNQTLNEYQQLIFNSDHPDDLVAIRKTELQGGDLYDTVAYGDQTVNYSRPFMFALQPQPSHPNYRAARRVSRVLSLYDNAGEHFQPGHDTANNPVTRHLAQSRFLLFLFDPTQHVRFRDLCRKSDDPQLKGHGRTNDQVAILHEAAARVRRHAGLSLTARSDRPLVVIVTKHDAWSHLLGELAPQEPLQPGSTSQAALDVCEIEKQSHRLRKLLLDLCPELVSAAEAFAEEVVYIPVSALGDSPKLAPGSGMLGARPRDIRPYWVSIPMLYAFCRWVPGLIATVKRST
jgi:hypothetical protein